MRSILISVLFLTIISGVLRGQSAPSVTTGAAVSITCNGAILNGTVNPNGTHTTPVAFEYGLTTSYGSSVTTYDSFIEGTEGITSVSKAIYGLEPNKTYHYRLVATNAKGTTNGSDQTFVTSSTSLASVYVNSAAGNDATGDGSPGNPFKTFTKGYASLANGGIMYLSGTFTWEDADETGDVDIYGNILYKTLTIQGVGSTRIRAASTAGSSTRRVFSMEASSNVTLKNLEICNGNLLTTGTINENAGGAIRSSISSGGSQFLTIEDCYIHDNKAKNGGAMYLDNTTLSLVNSTISDNEATISATDGSAGGIWFDNNTPCTITNSTFANNKASLMGGAIYFFGGGVTRSMTNCTIANNSTIAGTAGTEYGGGISMDAGTLYIKNTIVANNSSHNTACEDFDYYGGTIEDNGYNIIESTTGTFSGPESVTGSQVSLNLSGSLALNNAANRIPTLALSSGSIAINKANGTANNSVTIPDKDQRGAARKDGPDIGAYEFWDNEGSLPVELTSFTVSVVNKKVILNWQTATEVNNYGFEIERALLNNEEMNPVYEKIGFAAGAGNCNTALKYSYADSAYKAGRFLYRLKQIDNDGKYKYSDAVEILTKVLPGEFMLKQNYPNPFNPSTVISYQLSKDVHVSLKIYDVLGRETATLVNENQEAGIYSSTFDAIGLTSGLYIARIKAGNYSKSIKMNLIR